MIEVMKNYSTIEKNKLNQWEKIVHGILLFSFKDEKVKTRC